MIPPFVFARKCRWPMSPEPIINCVEPLSLVRWQSLPGVFYTFRLMIRCAAIAQHLFRPHAQGSIQRTQMKESSRERNETCSSSWFKIILFKHWWRVKQRTVWSISLMMTNSVGWVFTIFWNVCSSMNEQIVRRSLPSAKTWSIRQRWQIHQLRYFSSSLIGVCSRHNKVSVLFRWRWKWENWNWFGNKWMTRRIISINRGPSLLLSNPARPYRTMWILRCLPMSFIISLFPRRCQWWAICRQLPPPSPWCTQNSQCWCILHLLPNHRCINLH